VRKTIRCIKLPTVHISKPLISLIAYIWHACRSDHAGFVFRSKKLVIEVLDDEGHIIKRKRGVTATACVSSVAASQETPQFQGLPTGMKVTAFGDEVCRRGEADDMPQAVAPACRAACTISVTDYSKKQFDFSGYKLPEKDEQRMMKSCVRECNMSGTRPGKSFQFVVPYRR